MFFYRLCLTFVVSVSVVTLAQTITTPSPPHLEVKPADTSSTPPPDIQPADSPSPKQPDLKLTIDDKVPDETPKQEISKMVLQTICTVILVYTLNFLCPALLKWVRKVFNILTFNLPSYFKEGKQKKAVSPQEEWITSLLEAVKCPICLTTLHPQNVLCVNGHALCLECKQEQTKCPTCLREFSNLITNVQLRQVIEVINSLFCKYCKQLVDADHFKICGYHPAQCRMCAWTGSRQDVLGHVKEGHSGRSIFGDTNIGVSWTEFDLTKEFTEVVPISVPDLFLWQEMKHNPSSGISKITFHIVSTGNGENLYEVRLVFKSKNKNYESKLTLTMNHKDDQNEKNSILIPKTILEDFVTEEKKLLYDLLLTKIDRVN